jgi:hypothetical protein
MRIAFPIHRSNYYRPLGPVIEEALRRGHHVECWHDTMRGRGKDVELPASVPSALPAGCRVRTFSGPDELLLRMEHDPPAAVVALDPPPAGASGGRKTRWLWLQYSTDILFFPTPAGVLASDVLATYSPYWGTKLAQRFAESDAARDLEPRTFPVGMPELDVVSRIDPDEVRRRFRLPPRRPVVLYLPFPLRSNPQTFWLRRVFAPSTRFARRAGVVLGRRPEYRDHVRRGWNDRRLVECVREFCDRAGAVLVMKSRPKDPIPRYARAAADAALYDPSHFPPTILDLLSVSSLCIHAYSTAVFEAAYSGVPSLCLAPDRRDMGLPGYVHDFVHNGDLGGIYNWPGAAYSVPLREAFDGLRRWRLADFPLDAAARKRYVERFLGFDDGRSSGRLLDVAERLGSRG